MYFFDTVCKKAFMRDVNVFGASAKRRRDGNAVPGRVIPWWVTTATKRAGDHARGSFGTIVRVTNEKAAYAVKILDLNRDADAFVRETRFIKYVHDNIARIYAFHTNPNNGYLRMELATRDAFDHTIQKTTIQDRLDMAPTFYKHVNDGLEFMHSMLKLCHCDVKLENVLYFELSNTYKLADFGFTIEIESYLTDPLKGTLDYMIPYTLLKTLHDNKIANVGIMRDKWALASCMCCILTNDCPSWKIPLPLERTWPTDDELKLQLRQLEMFMEHKNYEDEDAQRIYMLPTFVSNCNLKEAFLLYYTDVVKNPFVKMYNTIHQGGS
jgi:serine/threonine protein kinase